MGIDARLYPDRNIKNTNILLDRIKKIRSGLVDPNKVRVLVAEYRKVLGLCDGGIAAKKTSRIIRSITTTAEQVKILESVKIV